MNARESFFLFIVFSASRMFCMESALVVKPPSPLENGEQATPQQRKIFFELRNVVCAMAFPKLDSLLSLASTPEAEQNKLFEWLQTCPAVQRAPTGIPIAPAPAPQTPHALTEQPETPHTPNTPQLRLAPIVRTQYPPVIKQWLKDEITTPEARAHTIAFFGYLHAIRRQKASIAFTAGIPAQTLVPHEATLAIVRDLDKAGTPVSLCTDFNSAEFRLLKEKIKKDSQPDLLEKLFPPERTYVSGVLHRLMEEPEFFRTICPEAATMQDDPDPKKPSLRPLFIGYNLAACDAAQQAGFISAHYDCKNETAPKELRKILEQQRIILARERQKTPV
jgi:hypothetical protein